MQRTLYLLTCCSLAFGMLRSPSLNAAANPDPFVEGGQLVELADLFVWSSPDTTHVNLVLTMRVAREFGWRFPPGSVFVFHVTSSVAYGVPGTETAVTCHFNDFRAFECWLGESYVSGATGVKEGVASADGRLRVFAGLRDDPAFFDRDSFALASNELLGLLSKTSLAKDQHGCLLSSPSLSPIGGRLKPNDPSKAADSLAGGNVMALVLQVPTPSLNVGGPVLGVWASAHRLP